jgi:hypothetical protein
LQDGTSDIYHVRLLTSVRSVKNLRGSFTKRRLLSIKVFGESDLVGDDSSERWISHSLAKSEVKHGGLSHNEVFSRVDGTVTVSCSFELGKSSSKRRDASSVNFVASRLETISFGLNIVVHIEDLRHYRLSESIFVRFPRWSFRIFYEGIEERIDDVVKRVDYFYGIVLIIVGPYITIFEFSGEGEVDLVAIVRTVRRNYSRNKTATTKTK